MVCFYLIQSVKNENEILFELNLIKGSRETNVNVNVKSTEINHFDRSDGNIGGGVQCTVCVLCVCSDKQ